MMGFGNYGYGAPDAFSGGGNWAGIVMMPAFGVLVLIGIVLLVVWIARSARHEPAVAAAAPVATPARQDEALAIAQRRLATGEIGHEQYAAIVRALGY